MKKVIAVDQQVSIEDTPTPQWIKEQLDKGRVLVMSDIPFDNEGTAKKFIDMGLKVSMEWTKNVHVGILYKNPETQDIKSTNFVFLAIPEAFEYAKLEIEAVQDYPSYVDLIRGFDLKTIEDQSTIDSHNLKVRVLPEACTCEALHAIDKELDAFVKEQGSALRGHYTNEVFNCQVLTEYILSKAYPELKGDYFPSQVDPLSPGIDNGYEARRDKLPELQAFFDAKKK